MKLLIELDEEYVKAIDKIRFLVGGRTDRKLQLEIIKAIKNGKALEQEPRWIPVSERLPEDSGEYFVTVIDEDVETYKHTGIAWYAHPKDYDVEEGEWRELMIDEKVIAWMPLPKAYRKVKE